MIAISKADAQRYIQKARTASQALARKKEQMTEAVESVVASAEVSATTFTFGVINGRWGGVELIGLPIDLWAGLGFHVLGFLGVAPKHMHAFGTGSLAAYSHTLGAGIGREMKEKVRLASMNMSGGPTAATSGGRTISDQYLANLARG